MACLADLLSVQPSCSRFRNDFAHMNLCSALAFVSFVSPAISHVATDGRFGMVDDRRSR